MTEEAGAGWTEERVELLKKLWMEGLSASQIAGVLGEGVTRNAVIGKVHRLKLPGRARPTSNMPPRVRTEKRPRGGNRGASRLPGNTSSSRALTPSQKATRAALRASPHPSVVAEGGASEAPQVQELFIPEDQRLTLLQLNEHTCKWPIGDPLSPDSYFCGQHSEDRSPYCGFHSRRAYHQVDKKKR